MAKNQQQQNNQHQPPQSEAERIRDRKRHVLDSLQNKFGDAVWRERLLKICGGDESRIMKSLNSFLTYILNDDGGKEGQKKYIADCSLSSISAAFLEAFQMGIEVGGGRDHAYLVNYAGQCELEISYKGFVYALGKHFDNPFVIAENVFDGDEFKCIITDSTATYTHTPKDSFSRSWEKLKGCYCYFSYTQRDNKERVSRLVRIQKDGPDSLDMIRSKAKGSHAWRDFPFEQTKKSTLRRAIKIPFAEIDFGDEEVNPETVDNRHYRLESSTDSGERLKLLMDKQKEMLDDEKPKQDRGITQGVIAGNHSGGQAGNGDAAVIINGQQEVLAPIDNEIPQGDSYPPVDHYEGEDQGNFQDIDDADFADTSAPSAPEGKPAPAPVSASAMPSSAPAVSGDAVAVMPSREDDGAEWDGRTLIIGGKAQDKDFPSAGAALVYLKKVIGVRTHKATRKSIIDENPKLIRALIKNGQGNAVNELHQLADKGE